MMYTYCIFFGTVLKVFSYFYIASWNMIIRDVTSDAVKKQIIYLFKIGNEKYF